MMSTDQAAATAPDTGIDNDVLDFEAERDRDGASWQRADPKQALIEKCGRFGWRVLLRDGEETHLCALGTLDGEYVGQCDCKGFLYHDGVCSHLSTLRKAEFIGEIAVEEATDEPEDEHALAQATGEVFEGGESR